MKQLVIVGARAMGRETCTYARQIGMTVKGFLDSDPSVLDGFAGYPPILGSVEEYHPQSDDVFVVALGDPQWKLKYAAAIATSGGTFVSIIHPTAYVGDNVRIGDGVIVCPNAVITNDIAIGNHVIVNVGATINHDNLVGDGSTISPGCHLAGRVKVGKCVFIGIGAAVIPDVSLGDGVFVAAGAVVAQSFATGRIAGVPAKLMDEMKVGGAG